MDQTAVKIGQNMKSYQLEVKDQIKKSLNVFLKKDSSKGCKTTIWSAEK